MTEPPLELITHALTDGTCTLVVFSKPRQGATTPFNKVSLRPVVIRRCPMFQLTYHYPNRETHENLLPAVAAARARELLEHTFEHAALFTPTADHAIRARADGAYRVKSSPPSKTAAAAGHNRVKAHLIPDGVPCRFLTAIGIMTPEGRVRQSMYHKFRQINRFLELVDDIVPELPQGRPLEVVDFGCGKSYLTFALHHLLAEIHRLQVRIVGVDRHRDVVQCCTRVAESLGLPGLEFRESAISDYESTAPVDLVVSLHACDTATDDALARAIAWNCTVILAAPCCQHELAHEIRNEPLEPMLRHGILRERFAALATDALRAKILEICGYRTQIIEFIDHEHTAKNLLIRGVRHAESTARRGELLQEYAAYKQVLRIAQPALERALGSRWQ